MLRIFWPIATRSTFIWCTVPYFLHVFFLSVRQFFGGLDAVQYRQLDLSKQYKIYNDESFSIAGAHRQNSNQCKIHCRQHDLFKQFEMNSNWTVWDFSKHTKQIDLLMLSGGHIHWCYLENIIWIYAVFSQDWKPFILNTGCALKFCLVSVYLRRTAPKKHNI